MNSNLKCENPGTIEYTITATMTAAQWEVVRERLYRSRPDNYDGHSPAGQLINSIDSLLRQVNQVFVPRET